MKGLYYIGTTTRMQIYFMEDAMENSMKLHAATYIGLGYGTHIPEHHEGEDIIYRLREKSPNNLYSYIRMFFGDAPPTIFLEDVTPFKKLAVSPEEEESIMRYFFMYNTPTIL